METTPQKPTENGQPGRWLWRFVRQVWCWDLESTHSLRGNLYRIVKHSWLGIYRVECLLDNRWKVISKNRVQLFETLRSLPNHKLTGAQASGPAPGSA